MRLQSIMTGCPVAGTDELCVRLLADGSASYDTYFGHFPAALWKKYTTADDFSLRLRVTGRGTARVFADGREIAAQDVGPGEAAIPFNAGDAACVYLRLDSGLTLESGCFEAAAGSARDVNIALNICTYRREEFVRRNMDILRHSVWDNPDSPLGSHLSAFISDNASTLEAIPHARVATNKNVGGSGGFARGLLEILSEGSATHAVFMDDDITLMPESLERLYALLRLIRPEYADAPVGGAMLRLDMPCVQHESLAVWHGLLSESVDTGLDLADPAHALSPISGAKADYSAWWFSCVPVSSAREKGLPLPIFVRMDDIEYGLRLGKSPIAMPGICVWHEPFERKHAAKTEYYHARNALIVNALRTPEMPIEKLLRNLLIGTLMRYRYDHAEMILRGMEDYMKGPEYLKALDPQTNDASLKRLNIVPLAELSQMGDIEASLADTRAQKLAGMLTLNGALFPKRGWATVHAHKNPVHAHFAKKGAVNVIDGTGTGFLVTRSNRRAAELLRRYARLSRTLDRRADELKNAWRSAETELTSAEFWKRYLDL